MPETQNPISSLAAAELAVVLKPIYSALTALQAPGANIATVIQAINMVELEEIAQLPAIESLGVGNVASALAAKLQAWEASIGAAANPPVAEKSAGENVD